MPKAKVKAVKTVKNTKLEEAIQKLETFITDGKAGDATAELATIRDELKSLA